MSWSARHLFGSYRNDDKLPKGHSAKRKSKRKSRRIARRRNSK